MLNIKKWEELTRLYLKNDVLLLTCVFKGFIKVSINEFGITPLYCVSLPGYTWQCGLNFIDNKLQTLQEKDMILIFENFIRGGISYVIGERYVKSDDNKKILYIDAVYLYRWAMSQSLPYDEIKFDRSVESGDILYTPDDCDNGYFLEVGLSYPDKIIEKN